MSTQTDAIRKALRHERECYYSTPTCICGTEEALAALSELEAHPPAREVVEAGSAMYEAAENPRFMHDGRTAMAHACERWRIALAQPKEVAPTVERAARCDYRKPGCVNDGNKINGVWVCKNHQSVKA